MELAFPQLTEKIKIANSENPHITLKFLGDTSEEVFETVDTALRQEMAQISTFSFTCNGTGCFPKPSHPSVLWVGINKGLINIEKIHRLIEQHLEKSGFEKEKKKFIPHLTFGRVKKELKRLDAIDAFLKYKFGPTENLVHEVIWFESLLTSWGAIHKPLRIYKLK